MELGHHHRNFLLNCVVLSKLCWLSDIQGRKGYGITDLHLGVSG
jgi:hypothetical protein